MALKSGIQISPVSKKHLKKKIDALSEFPYELNKIMKDEGKITVLQMRQDAPEDTGRLKRNIGYEVLFGGKEVILESTAIDPLTGRDYAPLQEYGIGVPKRPYFRKNVDIFFSRLKQRIDRTLKRLNR